MSTDGWMTGDPPCSYSNDHHWHGGSACSVCGERLRCPFCGQFTREDDYSHECAPMRAAMEMGCPICEGGQGTACSSHFL